MHISTDRPGNRRKKLVRRKVFQELVKAFAKNVIEAASLAVHADAEA
ncbi:MAG: hypothetical protein KAI61_04170 [Alphaproteobacteria bacterium]|nr:hypothetical protein [Alphaproteobacteria bacterium]